MGKQKKTAHNNQFRKIKFVIIVRMNTFTRNARLRDKKG